MKFYYPKDMNGNIIGFKTPESHVYDKNGVSLTDKLSYKIDKTSSEYIKSMSISGRTITYTKGDGSSANLITQDTTYKEATSSSDGLMSKTDKSKLDGIASGANAYTLPAATSSTLGGVKTGSNITNSSGTISITKENVVGALGYTPPSSVTTYGVATSTALGLVKSGTDITVDSSGNVSVNDDSHNHVISNVDGLQNALDGKANSSHGNHVPTTQTANNAVFLRNDNTWQTVTPDNIGAAPSSHTHSAYVNQNAFSNVVVGSTTVSADSATDTLTLVAGSNVTITPDATNDKITIAATNTTYSAATTSAAGLMSASDKSKLDGIASGANAYSLPAATSSALGGVKVGSNITNSSGTISITKANVTSALGYTPPTTDTNTWRPLGTTADTACAGNDSRLSNARPASDVYAWAKASSKPSYSWSEITSKPTSFTPSSHNQAASTITAGTLSGKVQANASAASTLGNAQVRDITISTTDLTAGSSALATGSIYIVYE